MDTIKSSTDISLVFSEGRRFHTPYMTVLVLKQRDRTTFPGGRVAFIAGKKNGNAVWRNSAKRRMREVCREVGGPWSGLDIAFVAKKGIMSAGYSDVRQTADKVFRTIEGIGESHG